MTKKELAILEKVFASEIEGALNHSLRLCQVRGKVVEKLVADGMLKKVTERLGGRFPVTVEGYELTQLGHLSYCMTCTDDGP